MKNTLYVQEIQRSQIIELAFKTQQQQQQI